MSVIAKNQPRNISRYRWDPALASFNCTPDAQAIYASLPFPSAQTAYSCPASEKEQR